MAKIEVIPPVMPENTYVLTLTRKEAEVACAIMGSVIGNSPIREITDQIYHILDKALDPTENDIIWSEKYNIIANLRLGE
jgi:hypothetical protein